MKNAIIILFTVCIPYRSSAQSVDTLDWQTRYETRVVRANTAAQMASDSTLPLKIRLRLYQNFLVIYEKSEGFLPSFESFQRIASDSNERVEMMYYMRQLSLGEARLYELEGNWRDLTNNVQGLQKALLLRK